MFKVEKGVSEADAYSNSVTVHPSSALTPHVDINGRIFKTSQSTAVKQGSVGLSNLQRRILKLSLGDNISINSYNNSSSFCYSLDVDVQPWNKAIKGVEIDCQELSDSFAKMYSEHYMDKDDQLLFDYQGTKLLFTITAVKTASFEEVHGTVDFDETRAGCGPALLQPASRLSFSKAAGATVKLTGQSTMTPIFQPNWNVEDLGIGGLTKEFSDIFRRAFASRLYPPSVVSKLGLKHVRGILLYGPPGTGKTLIARKIGQMLNTAEPEIINGPEILSKYVGQAEENLRKKFEPAEQDQEANGDDAGLHIIIFDEMDAICKQRGSVNDNTGVHDTVVNQLLSKMDGVKQLNNILVIGMTNRKDLIDEALMRPGRFEVHVEVSLPDETGRVEIFGIHTKSLRDNKALGHDVNLDTLAESTPNYSGAEIAGVVTSASSFAMNRHVDVNNVGKVANLKQEDILVCQADFMNALNEVKPAFGVASEDLNAYMPHGVVSYSDKFDSLRKDIARVVMQVKESPRTSLVSCLLYGEPGSGKTAIACETAMSCEYPFIKVVSPHAFIGMSEGQKCNAINKIFNDAYKSPMSVIILDDFERLIEYVGIGPRFSNQVLQALLVLLKRPPPNNHRLCIISTTSSISVLRQLDAVNAHHVSFEVPQIVGAEAATVLEKTKTFSPEQSLHAGEVVCAPMSVKRLIMVAELSNQVDESERMTTFAHHMTF